MPYRSDLSAGQLLESTGIGRRQAMRTATAVLAGGLLTVSTATAARATTATDQPTTKPTETPRPPSPTPTEPTPSVRVSGWGGCDLLHGGQTDQLKLELVIRTSHKRYDRVEISGLDIFGKKYDVLNRVLRSPDGKYLPYRLDGELTYNSERSTLVLEATGKPGTITVTGGSYAPPNGVEFPELGLLTTTGFRHPIRVPARKFGAPDHTKVHAHGPAVMAALAAFHQHLERRRTATGWLIAAPAHEAREESQAIAGIATGYLQYHQISGDPAHETLARRALDWLVANQAPDGGFGFPWTWGMATGHFPVAEHYEDGIEHPIGFPYAVNAFNSGLALIVGYEQYSDPRYLAAAKLAGEFAIENLQWLDITHTRASIPYCNKRPVVPPEHPALRRRRVVPWIRNSSVEFYNIDSYAIQLLENLRRITGERRFDRYVSALMRNILFRIDPDGAISYSWVQDYKPDFYTYAVAQAIVRYAADHGDRGAFGSAPFEAARRMMSWRANAFAPGSILNELDGVRLLNLDNTDTPVGYAKFATSTQKPDGSWSGGLNTREDVNRMVSASYLLVQAGYQPAGSRRSAPVPIRIGPLLAEPFPVRRRKRGK